jgi:hypothetical protein
VVSPVVALPESHASAAAAAVAAVARERAAAKAAAMRRASLRLDAVQDARRRAEQLRQRISANEGDLRGTHAQDRRKRGSKEHVGPNGRGPYVAEAAAARKWPDLSPRSAVQKEQAIQELSVLPDGMKFYAELSADETRRILNGLDD